MSSSFYFNGSTLVTGISYANSVLLRDSFRRYGVSAELIDGGLIHIENAPALDNTRINCGVMVGGTSYHVTTRHLIYADYVKNGGERLGDDLMWQIIGRVLREHCLP